jgi:MoaA/NifB/PqqE/SkfB family radical SAM enzyme
MIEPLRTAVVLPLNLLLLRRYPVSLVHFVTSRCNAACAHCFLSPSRRQTPGHELSLGEIEAVTRHAGPSLLNVNLTGGEPFLREDLAEIATLYVDNAGVRSVYVTTNGSDPERVLAFADALRRRPRCAVTVSLSLDDRPEAHDRQRGIPGLAERVVRTYRALLSGGGNVRPAVSMTLFEENAARALSVYRHLRDELGIRHLAFGPARDQGAYRMAPGQRARVHAAYREVLAEFRRDRAAGRVDAGAGETLNGRLLDRKNLIVHRLMEQDLLDGRMPMPCYAGRLSGVISESGDVYPCELVDESMGNVRDVNGDLMALWRSPRARGVATAAGRRQCACTYECAWTLNVLARPRFWLPLAGAACRRTGAAHIQSPRESS